MITRVIKLAAGWVLLFGLIIISGNFVVSAQETSDQPKPDLLPPETEKQSGMVLTGEEEFYYFMSASEFFRMERVRQPIDFARIDQKLLAAAIFHETNERRKRYGLAPLGYLFRLYKAAEMHARDMAQGGYLSHTNPDDPERRNPYDRVQLVGLEPMYVAENVATHFGIQYEPGNRVYIVEKNGATHFRQSPDGPLIPNHSYQSFAETLLDQWMDSEEHRENILSEKARYIGNACEKRTREVMDKFYCVQVFSAL